MSQMNLFELPELKKSTSSQEDSLAKTSRLRVAKKGYARNVRGYGRNSVELLTKYDQITRLWRTLQTCLLVNGGVGLAEYLGTWSRSGIMQSGIAYQLPTLVPRTSGTESGFLPTPQASDGLFYKIKRPMIMRGNAYRITSNQGIDGNAKLADIAWNVWGGPLNPEYVEAMMMYPSKWTDLNA